MRCHIAHLLKLMACMPVFYAVDTSHRLNDLTDTYSKDLVNTRRELAVLKDEKSALLVCLHSPFSLGFSCPLVW